MDIIHRISHMSAQCAKAAGKEEKIGLVPTMGAIHPGHISLIKAARKMTDLVVVSIFVNRLQFPNEDEYRRYPRDFTKDVDLLHREEVDYVFAPPEEEMYPETFSTYASVEAFGEELSGLPRSIYFRGTTTGILKLLNITQPSFIFFGNKDALQGSILRKMMRDMNITTEVVVAPVVRDPSGLAYAARNYFLEETDRLGAAVIYESLKAAEEAFAGGETKSSKLTRVIEKVLATESRAKLEYAVVADPDNLRPLQKVQGKAIIAVSAMIGTTSLNDSIMITSNP